MTMLKIPPVESPVGLLDVQAVADFLACSPRHICRLSETGSMPEPVRLGALVRWRLRTGDPMTGILDWIEAGCPFCQQGGHR
jgi:predicted DNA-binding transcriptional regulator AlpA